MPSINFSKFEYEYQAQPRESSSAGLGSDGELVQGVSETHPTYGAGSGKVNMDGLSIMKHVDTSTDEFEFNASASDEDDDHTPIPILHCPSDPPRDGVEEHFYTITLEDATIDATPETVDTFLF